MKSTTLQLVAGLGLIAALTIGPALLHGRFANRWSVPSELKAAAGAIEQFPQQVGKWRAWSEAKPLSASVIEELGITGYIGRIYRHDETGQIISLLLMVGEPGPLVRHPPDICYGNRANTLVGERRARPVLSSKSGGSNSEFRVMDYRPDSPMQEPFNVAYGFSTGGEWAVPDWPRMAYGGAPFLYKAQMQATRTSETTAEDMAPIENFLQSFVQSFAEYQTALTATK